MAPTAKVTLAAWAALAFQAEAFVTPGTPAMPAATSSASGVADARAALSVAAAGRRGSSRRESALRMAEGEKKKKVGAVV